MRNVVDDKGSFTVEASMIAVFIVVVVMNLIGLIFYVYDYCIIYEQINRDILHINNYIEKEGLGCKKDISGDIDIKNVIRSNKKDYNDGLLNIKVENVLYTIQKEKVGVTVVYRYKDFVFSKIYGKEKTCNLIRYIDWFDIKSNVRIN